MAYEETDGGSNNNDGQAASDNNALPRRKRKRWGAAAPPVAVAAAPLEALDAKARLLAQQESIKARLAAAKARVNLQLPSTQVGSTTTTTTVATTQSNSATHEPAKQASRSVSSYQPQTKKAKVYDLDLNDIGPTFKSQQSQNVKTQSSAAVKPAKKKTTNPYLAHVDNDDTVESAVATAALEKSENKDGIGVENEQIETDEAVDERLARASKPRVRNKAITFVEPGVWRDKAERQREHAATAQLYLSGRKTGHSLAAIGMGTASTTKNTNVYGPSDDTGSTLVERAELQDKNQPPLVLEWWDMDLLPTKTKKQVAAAESDHWNKSGKTALQAVAGKANKTEDEEDVEKAEIAMIEELREQCFSQFALSNSKTATLVQHIVPVKPPFAQNAPPPPQPTIYLTKKELKRQRKLRRQEKQRELQDLQSAGLIAAPEPRLTLQNFIQVMGDQAYLDPSQMERKVQQQMQARQRVHWERNQANKLTKEQRAAKLDAKLQEDTSQGVHVALFWVKDMSHPYHRAKVDLNAQQSYISGGVMECQDPALACVICEGGPKAIKRFKRLMLVRMSWTGPTDGMGNDDESSLDDEPMDGEDEQGTASRKFNPDNTCELVWEGMSTKRFFTGFVFQAVEASSQAKKILKGKGVGHYWDQVMNHASGAGIGFQLRLANSDDSEDDNPFEHASNDITDDVVMKNE